MWDFLERVFGGNFMPHGHCYLWTPSMVWAQVLSNTFIGLAYLSISLTLAYLVRRVRLPFSWVYIAFGVFILACGFTHFSDVITVWHPIYWADAEIRIVTAVASVGTAILVFPLVPKVLAIAQLSEVARERGENLERAVGELTEANARIVQEQEQRAQLAAENAALAEKARMQEFQERFLAILGHDLRNPLAAIEMGTALLRQDAAPRDTKILGRMESSSRRMSRMVDQILDLTRSRLAGGLEVHPVEGDLLGSVKQIIDELRVANPSRVITFTGPEHALGMWDRDRVEQILSNLIGNALEHGSKDHPITVDLGDDAQEVTITVHNHGAPIPDELRERLFDPFRRGSRESRTSQTAGLGLGLYISREIAISHGGRLDVESSESSGTTFRLRLPKNSRPSHPEKIR